MGEGKTKSKEESLYTMFPFMEAFPFKGYQTALTSDGVGPVEIGIAPIIVEQLGSFGVEKSIAFTYLEGDIGLSVSFYQEDVAAIHKKSDNIKKMNAIRESLDAALTTEDLTTKILAIRESKKFLRVLDLSHLTYQSFDAVLETIAKTYKVAITSDRKLGLQRLIINKVLEPKISKNEGTAIQTFLNFRLHYSKIILGIVIASKIY